MMSSAPKLNTGRILPPWLWFWLATYVLSLPSQMQMWERIWQSIRSLQPNPDDILPFGYLLNLSTVLEAVPLLAVFVGVLTIFVPKIRTARLERQFRLSAPPQKLAVMQEICVFIYQHAPRIVVRANLQRFDQLAFAYPVGYQKAAIALFGGFIKLWRMDQKAAQASYYLKLPIIVREMC